MPSIAETLAKRALKREQMIASDRPVSVHPGAGLRSFSSAKIWSSRVSWRIAATVFMAILFVQTTVLNLGVIGSYEKERLDVLSRQVQTAVASIINSEHRDASNAPFEAKHVERLLKTSCSGAGCLFL